MDTLKFNIPAKAEYVSTVRLAVSSVANRAGFDIEDIEDIKVAVSEACTNVIKHSKIQGENAYEICMETDEQSLSIHVSDTGVGFDTEDYEEPDLNVYSFGGIGIYIIKALMDEVNVTSAEGEGTVISMKKYVKEIG